MDTFSDLNNGRRNSNNVHEIISPYPKFFPRFCLMTIDRYHIAARINHIPENTECRFSILAAQARKTSIHNTKVQ